MMDIVSCIGSISQALAEIARFLQTEQGQKVVSKALEDRAALDKALRDAGAWVEDLFSGRLGKP